MFICMFFIMAFFHVLFLLTYTVTTNVYKVTARIVLILSHFNWERGKLFITLFYSISLVLGPKRLVTIRVSAKFKDKYFISGSKYRKIWQNEPEWMPYIVKIIPVKAFQSVNGRIFSLRFAYVSTVMSNKLSLDFATFKLQEKLGPWKILPISERKIRFQSPNLPICAHDNITCMELSVPINQHCYIPNISIL